MDGIEKQLETIALELHDAGDHDSGGVLDRIATELAALREERDKFRGLLEEIVDDRVWLDGRRLSRIKAALGKEDAGA